MKKPSLSSTFRLNLRRSIVAGATAIGAFGPAGLMFGSYDHLSGDRTGAVGDAQYAVLDKTANDLLARDKYAFNLSRDVSDMTQKQVTTPGDASLAAKIKARKEEQAAVINEVQSNFATFTRNMLISEAISEKDAINLYGRFGNSYALSGRYDIQKNFNWKASSLDECQIRYKNDTDAAKTGADQPLYIDSCLNKVSNPGELAGLSAFIGAMGGLMGFTLFGLPLFISTRHDDLYEASKRERARLKSEKEFKMDKKSKDSKLEITVRRK